MSAFKTIRKRLGVTQTDLADRLEVSQASVSFYENGRPVPPAVAGKLIEFAKSRGVDITYDDVYGAQDTSSAVM